ncbi:amidohydrolase family protein [Pseudescherichia sp.]|uniref:amidohydrolase family protein n=1 Tax=Pseudescherichia sp. TaxID=2055881 RepID=UPI002897EA14|nr:amidohydrolase family protein [Pseudescherichia sp.]
MTRVLPFLPALLLGLSSITAAADNNRTLIRNGYVLPMTADGKDRPNSDILIEGNKIVEIGSDLSAPGAEVIDASGKYVLPGFVDAHNHLWVTTMRGQFRNNGGKFFPVSNKLAKVMQPQDIHTAMYTGALELLQSGVTTTGDFFDNIHGPEWGDAGLTALKESGIRAIMYYGGPDKTTQHEIDIEHMAALQQQATDRVRLGLGWRLPRDLQSQDNWAMRDKEFNFARKHKLPVQVHVSGDAKNLFDALIARGYLNSSVTVVHATDATPEQQAALVKAGGSLVLTPTSEQRVAYGITRLDNFRNVERQGLGIDGNALAGTGNMFENLRLAALTESGAAKDEAQPDPRDVLALATRRGAEALGLADITGTLEPGKRADMQIIDPASLNMAGFGGGDPAAYILYSAQPQNVQTVLVDGKVVKRNGQLVEVDLPALMKQASDSAKGMVERAE